LAPARAARIRSVLAPAILLATVLALWQARVFNDLFGLETFALPLPGDIVSAASEERAELASAFRETFEAVLLGFALGNSVGFLLALGLLALPIGAARRASSAGDAIQALPIVATAPLVALWIPDPLWFKAVVVMILTFPSMLVFAYRGMTSVDPRALELASSYNASRWQVLAMLRLPSAIPHLFTALKYTSVLALIGVVVSEILRANDGLGFQIHEALQQFHTAEAWAAVGILAMAGILSYLLIVGIERFVFPWSVRRDSP
jgi:NitT/TauT family transport system permease protein